MPLGDNRRESVRESGFRLTITLYIYDSQQTRRQLIQVEIYCSLTYCLIGWERLGEKVFKHVVPSTLNFAGVQTKGFYVFQF